MDDGGPWGWVVAGVMTLTTIAGVVWALWLRVRRDWQKVRAEDAEADAEQKSTEVKQGQRETDYAIKKYRDFADHMEGKYLGLQKLYAALGERVDVLQASEVNCRVELAGVKQDNVHLHEEAVRLREEVESLKARIAFLEGTGP